MIFAVADILPADQIFNHGWFRVFYVFNKFGFNSFIALVETLFFSSVRRPNVSLPAQTTSYPMY